MSDCFGVFSLLSIYSRRLETIREKWNEIVDNPERDDNDFIDEFDLIIYSLKDYYLTLDDRKRCFYDLDINDPEDVHFYIYQLISGLIDEEGDILQVYLETIHDPDMTDVSLRSFLQDTLLPLYFDDGVPRKIELIFLATHRLY
jgi:hypothetical protein